MKAASRHSKHAFAACTDFVRVIYSWVAVSLLEQFSSLCFLLVDFLFTLCDRHDVNFILYNYEIAAIKSCVDQLMQVPFQRKKEHSFERKQRMCTV
jgi:hypothetical protein